MGGVSYGKGVGSGIGIILLTFVHVAWDMYVSWWFMYMT